MTPLPFHTKMTNSDSPTLGVRGLWLLALWLRRAGCWGCALHTGLPSLHSLPTPRPFHVEVFENSPTVVALVLSPFWREWNEGGKWPFCHFAGATIRDAIRNALNTCHAAWECLKSWERSRSKEKCGRKEWRDNEWQETNRSKKKDGTKMCFSHEKRKERK